MNNDLNAYNPFSAVSLGLADSLTACSLVIFLGFIIFLVFTAGSPHELAIGGIYFISVVLFTKFFQVLGAFDHVREASTSIYFIRLVYFVIAGCFLVVGLWQFRDWAVIRKNKTAEDVFKPAFLSEQYGVSVESKGFATILENLYLLFWASLVAFFLTSLTIVWPQNDFLFLPYFSIFTEYKIKGFLTALLYGIFYVFFLTAFWMFLMAVLNNPARRKKVIESLAFIKIVMSAVFIGLGAGIFYLFQHVR